MGYERYPRANQGDLNRDPDYARDYGSGRDYTYSSARDYAAAGYDDRGSQWRGRDRDYGPQNHGRREYYSGRGGYGREDWRDRDSYGSRDDDGGCDYGREREYGRGRDYGRERDRNRGYEAPYRGSYMSDGRRELDYGDNRQRFQSERNRGSYGNDRNYGRQPEGYDYQDRGFLARAGDEVRSWFGDEDAERRREMDQRYDERYGDRDDDSRWSRSSHGHDEHYHNWRRSRIAELDRDYDEYRRENATRFENEFNTFRTERQTQRAALARVREHMEVVGSDGEHVGTVDRVQGDRILLTKSDQDAGGRHHSIPSRWIDSVDDKVKIRKTADEAKSHWRDEEDNQAMFGREPERERERDGNDRSSGHDTNLNRSFSGTY